MSSMSFLLTSLSPLPMRPGILSSSPFTPPALHLASWCSPAAVIALINYMLIMLCIALTDFISPLRSSRNT